MEYITLKDIAIINMGQSPDSKTYNEEKNGIPFYQGKSDFGRINPIPRVWCSNPIKIAEKEDILISVRAPIGDTNIATEKCCIGRGVASIRPLNANVNQKYLYYLLNSKYKELNKFGTGSTFKAITKDNLCNLKCAQVPEIKEQIEVVKKLDNVSQIIEIKKEQLERLDTIIKSQFVEMFENENRYVNLEEVCVFINGDRGKNYPSADKISKDSNGIPFINAGLLINNTVDWDNMNYISEEAYNKLGSGKIQKEDILYCLRGSLGKHSIIDFDGKGAIASSLVILRADQSKIQPNFLLIQLSMDEIIRQQNQANNGSSQPNLSASSVKKYRIKLPSIELQNKFVDIVKQIDKQKFESEIELRKIQKNIFYKWGR
mgnify:CR=1 FL=1